ncbi:MAG: YkgJ family cysteine cluster protein [Microlunatus sp.]
MTAAALSTRDRLWNACAHKTCCRSTRVHVTGADLVRLVESLELPAVAMVTAVQLPRRDGHGFLLRAGGPRWELVLRKSGRVGSTGAPCVFLLQTNDGHACCGAGELRPSSCRAFPAVAAGDEVGVVADYCGCHAWSAADLGENERTSALAAATEELADSEAVGAWNAMVRRSGRTHTIDEFCDHLLSRRRSR